MNKLLAASALGLVLGTAAANAAAPLSEGAVVRLQSRSIEGGWRSGRMHLDQQKCWMVRLDKATKDDYMLLALIVVDELQVARGDGWETVAVKPVLQGQPAACNEYAAD